MNVREQMKFENVWAKIQHLLKENGLAATVYLHQPGVTNYYLHYDTPNNGFMHHPEGLRMRVKEADYNGDKAKTKQVMTDTYNLVDTMIGSHEFVLGVLHSLKNSLDQHVTHEDIPPEEPNNATGFSQS